MCTELKPKQPTISVIVPVYKVEPYLDRCVQSIVDQTYTDLEIILVDDGSPDSCPAMCDAWADKVIDLLNENQIVQCTSEEALRYRIGGISGSVIDYTMSLTGPGEKAKSVWKYANNRGLDICAKVQLNNTWEMAAVPYIPVFDKIFEHIGNLKNENVGNLLASWTLGGCPSINLELAEWLMCGKGNVQEFLEKKLKVVFSEELSERCSTFHDKKNYNKEQIEKLYEKNKAKDVINILNKSLKEMYRIYIMENNGMKEYNLKYDLIQIEQKNGKEYAQEYNKKAVDFLNLFD